MHETQPDSPTHDLILGTAGHIDHGKTTLIQALTGINCDRLPEEKARGITIDIGFAHLDLGEYRLGIVDVPGHERFVKNMLAGATGIDLALLIVAADDSIMPQTREHLAILNLLGVRWGVVALTKADLVDDTTREVVELEIRDLLRGTALESAAIIPTSTVTGLGLEALKAELRNCCLQAVQARIPDEPSPRPFRLPIDRNFVVQGHGTVVTGSVLSGSVRVGDEVEWHKSDGSREIVRVRSLNNHGQSVAELHRGQRGGINLAGVSHEAVQRGQELAAPGSLLASRVLSVRLTALGAPHHGMKHRLPVRLHIGTAEVMGTAAILDADRIEPGQTALAQLFLEESVLATWGQPFILRDSSAEHTLGGGIVLQPTAHKVRRRHLSELQHLEQLANPDPLVRLAAAIWFQEFPGIERHSLARESGIAENQLESAIATLLQKGTLVPLALTHSSANLLHSERWKELAGQILDLLKSLHEQNPLATVHDRGKIVAGLNFLGPEELLNAALDRLIAQKQLVGDARKVARADFKPKLSANQRKLKAKIVEEFLRGGFQPPEPASFANQAGGNAAALKDIFEVSCAEGDLVAISHELFLHAEVERRLRHILDGLFASKLNLTVGDIREALGTTRKFAVPICEYLDRTGFTRREGDLRTRANPEASH